MMTLPTPSWCTSSLATAAVDTYLTRPGLRKSCHAYDGIDQADNGRVVGRGTCRRQQDRHFPTFDLMLRRSASGEL
jgi:hypothetical protein